MADVVAILARIRSNPRGIRFTDLCKVLDHYFGACRQKGTSHRIYKTPSPADPRVNVQRGESGFAKAYQVRQCVLAIDMLTDLRSQPREGKKK